jgi:hypothetical protein
MGFVLYVAKKKTGATYSGKGKKKVKLSLCLSN